MSLDLLTARLAKSGARRTALPAASREAVHTANMAATRATLDYSERRASERYALTVSRMQSLMTERTYLAEDLQRHRDAGCWTACNDCKSMRERARVVGIELSAVFAHPVMPEDMAPSGRFSRRVRYLMTTHASRIAHGDTLLGSETADDIVMRAVVAAYTHAGPNLTEWRGRMVPTLGSLYGFTRREYFRAISEAKRERRTTSLDAMVEAGARPAIVSRAESLASTDPASLDWDNPASMRGMLTRPAKYAVPASIDDAALADRVNARAAKRAKREETANAEAKREERMRLAAMTATLTGDSDRDVNALGVDAAVVHALASGEHTLAECAAFLGIRPETLARRLASVRVSREAIRRIGSDGRPRAKRSEPVNGEVRVTVVRDSRAYAASKRH